MQLLRAWERRYGVVTPARTDSGYRLYDDASITRLRAMRRLVDDGFAPSTAAGQLKDLDDAGVADLLERAGTASSAISQTVESEDDRLREAFVDAAAQLDEPYLELVLDAMFARGSYEHVTSALILPALVDLGQAWADGRVDVAAEHAGAGAVQRRLAMAFMAAGAARDGDNLILVGMPPGGRHDLGALIFATTARRAGLSIRFLGADLPAQDWVDAVRRTSARAVVIGVVVRTDVRAATEAALAIRAADPRVTIAFGGRRAAAVPTSEIERVLVLPGDMTSAVSELRDELARPR